ncbi:hypothetical protein B0T19DRAFT_395643 [Cercophora scortea]|uniref:Extracellular membrane protein CFEM domain-containing protein n=1 Tax=Cercophora scortea TaxID=314031 RepID=A0AAE0J3G6_9PEZI|nr:hypothetical protein B0T19DRAFT_395643 [Cercophora scortea]
MTLTSPLLLTLLLILPVAALEEVSIYSALTKIEYHFCISKCLVPYRYSSDDLGDALSCDTPYANPCYCATGTAAAQTASSFIASCGSSVCAAGDAEVDITSMHSLYASYCINAGWTPVGATAWYNPASTTTSLPTPNGGDEQPTPAPTPGGTVTRVTVVTQTVSNSAAVATGVTRSQVTVEATSTKFVGPDGSPISVSPNTGSSSNDRILSVGLGLGLGIGIPLLIALAGIGYLLRRRDRRAQVAAAVVQPPSPPTSPHLLSSTPASMGVTKPPPLQPSEQEIHAEEGLPMPPRDENQQPEMTQAPIISQSSDIAHHPLVGPNSPVSVVPGQYEMSGEGIPPSELRTQTTPLVPYQNHHFPA